MFLLFCIYWYNRTYIISEILSLNIWLGSIGKFFYHIKCEAWFNTIDFYDKLNTFQEGYNISTVITSTFVLDFDSTTTFSSCWLILFLWSLSNRLHFFILLLAFEVTFASFCIEFISISAQYLTLEGFVFSLSILTFAALESIIGLSYLVFVNRTCYISQLTNSF